MVSRSEWSDLKQSSPTEHSIHTGAHVMANHPALKLANEKYIAIVTELGLTTEIKSNWLKILGPGSQYRVYVPLTKTVARVDIAGFEFEHGVKPAQGEFGNVKQQLDINPGLIEEQVLARFKCLLQFMKKTSPILKA